MEEKEEKPFDKESADTTMTQVDFDLLETDSRWLLKVLSGPNTGAEFSMHGGSSYIIGTDPHECDVVFQDLSVSRKHAKLTIDTRDNAILEDMGSKNGTFADGEKISGKKTIQGNVLVSTGTTTFMLIDREAERTTITAPLPFAKEKKEETPPGEKKGEQKPSQLEAIQQAVLPPLQSEVDKVKEEEKLQAKISHAVSSFVVLAIVTGLILIVGIGTALLFHTEEIVSEKVQDPEDELTRALSDFPAIRFSYNPTTAKVLLVGHVLTTVDRSKLLDALQQLKFISEIDYSNIVIDELVWREINQVLVKNPAWKSITISSPTAGHFILSGFLKTKKQSEELSDYLSQNFAYMDLLDRKIVVEEELLVQVKRELGEAGFKTITPVVTNGELTLTGAFPFGTKEKLQRLISAFKSIPGIRSVQMQAIETGQKEYFVDITTKYQVTGYSKHGLNVSVVINGHILAPGDTLDGMFITDITPNTVYLEKDGVKYKIDFNR